MEKNNFKRGLITSVDVYIPIQRKQDWSNALQLSTPSLYEKIDIIGLKVDVGKVSLTFQGKNNTFLIY